MPKQTLEKRQQQKLAKNKELHFITNARTPFLAPGFQRSLNPSTAATAWFPRPPPSVSFSEQCETGAFSNYCWIHNP